jgi:hypothetical protein
MRSSSILFASFVVVVAGCTIERVDAPPPAAPTTAATPAVGGAPAATTPPPANTISTVPTATPTSGGSVGGGVGVVTPVGGAGAGGSVSWSGWKGAEQPNSSCVKESNKELCWDGVDNNCNGQIDEGCPYGGGNSALHILIAWKANVDLDLHVVGPDGNEISFKNRVGGELMLDKDCHGDDCPQGNVENVFVPIDKVVAKGHYRFWIQDGNPKTDKDPTIPFMMGIGVGAKAFFVPAMITNKSGEQKAYEFDAI